MARVTSGYYLRRVVEVYRELNKFKEHRPGVEKNMSDKVRLERELDNALYDAETWIIEIEKGEVSDG